MKPIILDFKLSRSEQNSPIVYQYDSDMSLNVILVDGQKKPFIDLNDSDVELQTKTRAHRENDDESFLLELGTKTEQRRERDDRHDTILEMESKTLAARERDDRHDAILEMSTKTFSTREREDQNIIDYQQN